MNGFGERLSKAIADTGCQLQEISKKLSISKASLINYKNGKTPHIEAVIKLASFCNVSLDWLLLGKEYKLDLSDNEKEIIKYYRVLDSDKKNSIYSILKSLAGSSS